MKRLLKLAAAPVLFAVALSAPLRAQEPPADGPQARKVDEFAQARGCDHGARLDNFGLELMNNPDAVGYVVAYGPAGEGSGTADYRLRVTKHYLVNLRGIAARRLRTLNAGRYRERGESFVELWLVPLGAAPPRPAKYRNDADTFSGKFSESEAWDSFEWGEETGPSTGNSTLAGFADVLKSQPEARAYIVAFNSEESAPGAWRRVARGEADDLQGYGVSADRVQIIFGGYGEKLRVQLWALPKEAPPPAKDAGAERRAALAAKIGSMGSYQLRYEKEARSFFRGFAEVLKADESLTAHVVVWLEAPRAGATAEPLSEGEPPEIDMVRLAESWRDDLSKEYGIGPQRFVVQVVPPAEEWSGGSVEAWVVPAGAAPPDPYAPAEEEVGGAEESQPKEL